MPSCFARAFPLLGFCAVVFAQTTPSTASQTGIVEGDVTDSVTHKPIAGARVMLQADKGVLFTRCDGNGRFQFQPVPLGDGLVLADQAGYVGISQPPIPARLSPGKTRIQVHILLQPAGIISGRITDTAGVAAEGVTVELLQLRPVHPKPGSPAVAGNPPEFAPARATLGDNQMVAIANSKANDLGEYRFAGLPPGSYYVYAWTDEDPADQEPVTLRTYYPRAIQLESASPVAVSAGQEVSNIDIQAVRQIPRRIAGHLVPTVYSPKGHSFPIRTQVVIWLADAPERSQGDLNWQGGWSGSDFAFGKFLPGKYVIEALASDQPDFLAERRFRAGRRTFELSDKDLDNLEIPMQPLFDLHGAVAFAKNCPAAPVSVQAEATPSFVKFDPRVADAATGAFTLPGLFPARYTLTIRPQPPRTAAKMRYSVASAQLGDQDVLKSGFELDGPPAGTLRIAITCGGQPGAGEVAR